MKRIEKSLATSGVFAYLDGDMNETPSRATAINIQCIQHGEVLSVASATLCARDSELVALSVEA